MSSGSDGEDAELADLARGDSRSEVDAHPRGEVLQSCVGIRRGQPAMVMVVDDGARWRRQRRRSKHGGVLADY